MTPRVEAASSKTNRASQRGNRQSRVLYGICSVRAQAMPEKQLAWPYNLPIWRRWHRAESPNGCRVAVIDPAHEVSMGNATSGMLCVTGGPHIERCNPSFLWSEDSNYLAVPQYHGFWGRQRLLILVFHDKCVFASKQRDSYFQPESFSGEKLVVRISPFKSDLVVTFNIPTDLPLRFQPLDSQWPESL